MTNHDQDKKHSHADTYMQVWIERYLDDMRKYQEEVRKKYPPMKFEQGDEVAFKISEDCEEEKIGKIRICDFGGAWGLNCHSYDVHVYSDNTLYKHIPEKNIRFYES